MTVETRRSDIARPAPGDLAGASLITASALLDMLSADELAAMLGACTEIGCPILLALTVVGRVGLTPADRLDTRMAAAFNAHQRRTTTAGRLLGPDAVAAAVETLRATGAEVLVRPSPWRLDAAHADLTPSGSPGGSAPPASRSPRWPPRPAPTSSGAWRRRPSGISRVTVDHADLLMLP